MASVSYEFPVDRSYVPALDKMAAGIAARLGVDLTVTVGVRHEPTPDDQLERLHHVGHALDFQVQGYVPLGALPLEGVFQRILALHDELFEDLLSERASLQLVLHPGDGLVPAHIHIGFEPRTARAQARSDQHQLRCAG